MAADKFLLTSIILAFIAYSTCKEIEFINEKPSDYETHAANFRKGFNVQSTANVNRDLSSSACENTTRSSEQNCVIVCNTETPYVIVYDNKKHIVVQSTDFVQRIKTVSCLNEKARCFQEVFEARSDIITSCETTKAVMTMFIYDPVNQKVSLSDFTYDVWCNCILTKNLKEFEATTLAA